MDLPALAALVFAIAAAGVVAFQFTLALGAPWGAYAMGGSSPGRFPAALRAAAVVQGLLIAAMVAVVLARAGVALAAWEPMSRWAIWVVVAFSGLSLGLNSISPSGGERRLWVPVTAILLGTSLVVALTTR